MNQIPRAALIEDLQRVARLLGGCPTVAEYDAHGQHHSSTGIKAFRSWATWCREAGLGPAVRRRRARLRGEVPRAVPAERRPCLRCDRMFLPQGRFNRICPSCKTTQEWREPAVGYRIVRTRERRPAP